MNRTEKMQLARLIRALTMKLRQAPTNTLELAKKEASPKSTANEYAYAFGALGAEAECVAADIERLVGDYLDSKRKF